MSGRPFSIAPVALAVGAAAACALLTGFGLTALARPADFEARLARVEADAATAARLLRPRDLGPALPADGACSAASPEAARALRAELARVAETFRLEHPIIDVAPEPPTRLGEPLTAFRVRFEASGQYDGVLGAVSRLGDLRPLIFIDVADLESKTSFVTLSLSGRAYCSAL